jgi:hypothetical protein
MVPPFQGGCTRGLSIRTSLIVGKNVRRLILSWAVVAILLAVDLTWARLAGLHFTGWWSVVWTVGFLAGIGFFYQSTGRNARLADVGNYAALWVGFSAAGAIFTYVVATLRMPLWDAQLTALDAAMGFDWTGAVHFIVAHPYLRMPLAIVYETMLPQIIGSILFFAHTCRSDRNREFLWIGMVSLLITTAVSGVIPALGPCLPGHPADFTRVLVAIREGTQTNFALDNMKGIITMPSYHTVIALVLMYVHRPPARSFPAAAMLNLLMLLSVPWSGHHFLSDMLAGAVVTVVSVYVVRRMAREADEVIESGAAADHPAVPISYKV